ncbi:MAG: GNAT family N-acetyltransferase [Prevotella sp.]|nr:GNAT family N-acetyltransferase [Prevotella sp.]
MNEPVVHIITKECDLPELDNTNFFHSRQLFEIARQTPRQKPYMIVAKAPDGQILAHMLSIVRYRTSWFPPYLYMHCRLLGEGVYTYSHEGYTENALFGMMLDGLRNKLSNRVLYIEVSNLSQKMFGYRELKQRQFFPVHWMSIHNSLHSHTPEERISKRLQKHIDNAYAKGVVTNEVNGEKDFEEFMKLLRQHHWLKPKRYIPDRKFFLTMKQEGHGRLYLTRYHEHIIGCSAVAYSSQNAYLWYTAFRRKTYALVHPDELTLWHAIKDAHSRGYQHIFFLDVGLPFSRNPFREFILRFGGKPVSTYRWFRCSIRWINAVLSWIYRD